MKGIITLAAAGASMAAAASCEFENLVVFGDSYSDNGRLAFYYNNNGTAPPPGVLQTPISNTSSGGLTWGQYVQERKPNVGFFDYAISGATCSNKIVSRFFAPMGEPFPSVMDDEIPSFLADVASPHILYQNRTSENTVFALWIGTNDLSFPGFLGDSQAPGSNITTYIDCVWQVLDSIYSVGGRRFVLFNQAPLHLTPAYRPQADGGAGDNMYWLNKTSYNETEYANKMLQYTTSINTIFDYGAPFNLLVKHRWRGASVSLFNVHQLLADIYQRPDGYLSAPANSTGYFYHCDAVNTTDCTYAPGTIDNYLFYDELHPSPKTDSIIADNFLDVVAGVSKYGTTYS
ncbi:acetyl esterase [Ophiostoma piceae UAMH 11346]|uniref:Acetyl esterase n=1 Tax=Ophiostoma piceae (strain UAMH 11346) TaxID=1262450 RepID=S3BUN1_OPHP1|nr:acetyl esterase [Ophiostoma piceae UAMH 11346]